jgi:hypothetical protein
MPARRERQAHDRVAGFDERQIDSEIGWRARVRLNISVLHSKQLASTGLSQKLYLVDNFVPLVISLARISLAILVYEDRTVSFKYG